MSTDAGSREAEINTSHQHTTFLSFYKISAISPAASPQDIFQQLSSKVTITYSFRDLSKPIKTNHGSSPSPIKWPSTSTLSYRRPSSSIPTPSRTKPAPSAARTTCKPHRESFQENSPAAISLGRNVSLPGRVSRLTLSLCHVLLVGRRLLNLGRRCIRRRRWRFLRWPKLSGL